MGRYFETAQSIFNWLAQYQIKQKVIHAKLENGYLRFSLEHPIAGRIDVVEKLSGKNIFRSNGIALSIVSIINDNVELEVYDAGGIWDPVDKLVPGDHYATTHFALLGAILYQRKKETAILERVKCAIEFHIRTLKDEYYFGEWGYHWDFQNYAFLEVYRILASFLPEDEQRNWRNAILASQENLRNRHTNWIAMRAYFSLMKYAEFSSFSDLVRFYFRLFRVNRARKSDGSYDDFVGKSKPIQYHVYTLALLHRIYLLRPNTRLKKKLIDGIKYFIHFIDPDGCFNYFGRGQEQIFGYAVGIYILEAAKKLDPENVTLYHFYLEKVWSFLQSYKRSDGHFPLVLNSYPDEKKMGWYDYHHLTVYEAFLGAWLGLTDDIKLDRDIQKAEFEKSNIRYFPGAKIAFVSKDDYFIAIAAGSKDYLSESGLTPAHIWFKGVGWVFSCPGGPSTEKFGKKKVVAHVDKNFWAPLILTPRGSLEIPAQKEFELKVGENSNDRMDMSFDYGIFVISRSLYFKNGAIEFEDTFLFKQDMTYPEIRFVNLPINIEKFEINIFDKDLLLLKSNQDILSVKLIKSDFENNNFEFLEKIDTAKGVAQLLVCRELNFKVSRNLCKSVKFSLSKKQ